MIAYTNKRIWTSTALALRQLVARVQGKQATRVSSCEVLDQLVQDKLEETK